METVLSTQNLTKRYGRITAVDGLSLEIPAGSIYGILGPNGSGKTTTLGMVLDVIHPTGGGYSWFGQPPTKENRKKVGAILEGPLFYPYLSGHNNLKIVADIKGVSYSRIEPKLDMVGLLERQHSPFRTYSLGMKQRLAIAAAMLCDPRVLILDEPTNGLDPQGIAEIRQLIRDIGQGETTIFLASHLLDEVEKVCSHVAVLKTGKLLYSGPVEGMITGHALLEVAAEDMAALRRWFETREDVEAVRTIEKHLLVGFSTEPDAAAINRALFEAGIAASHLALRKSTLEEQFLELTNSSQ